MAEPLVNNAPTHQDRTVALLTDTMIGSFNTLKAAFNNGQVIVWQNPFGLTPQQVFDIFGSRAAQLESVSASTVAFLNGMRQLMADPGEEIKSLKPDDTILAINPDGSVSVG